jgi:predicted hotdog family 3-hydroxylacyl-ACP dehydratase
MSKFEDIPILRLIPQRPPFVMVDRLVEHDDTTSVTEFEVREDNIFFEDGCLSASGLVENIAQTCAADTGIKNLNSGTTVKIGVIGSVSNLSIFRLPKNGEKLTTTIKVIEEIFQMTMVEATVCVGTEELARANMKIALTDIDSKD